ncbi:MAG TPA: polysaccharide deacetylase family protein [Bacteroidota bacterium]|nr:polysaccharide deacetylase family protein [Bacteroidota bacterium]
MKRPCYILLSATVILCSGRCLPQSTTTAYEIGTWQGFRSAAISYTFDDNCPSHFSVALPMFDSCGLHLTLFGITNVWPYWKGWQNAVANGHEVGSHTVGHPYLDSLTESEQLAEIKGSEDALNARVTGQRCVTLAYPYGHIGDTNMVRQFYIAARTCQTIISPPTPANFMAIGGIMCGAQGTVRTTADFDTFSNRAARKNGWCVYVVHALDKEKGASPLPSDTLRASLAYLKAHQEIFWVAPFGVVAKYIKERNSASVSELSIHPDSIVVQVTDTLDNSIYNCPLTIRRLLPAGWDSSIVIENGKLLNSQIVEIGGTKYVMFDVIPQRANSVLLKKAASVTRRVQQTESPVAFSLSQNYPNPFNPTTIIAFQIPASCWVTLKLYNILGQEVAVLVNDRREAGRYESVLDASSLSSGAYFYRLQAGDYLSTRRLLVLR